MNETKILVGGMDSDNAIEYIHPNDYIKAQNYRPTGTDSQDSGYGNNIESTVEIPSNMPQGITKTIGVESYETIRKIYEIRYNSNGNHQLIEIDFDSKSETIVFENLTQTNGKDILKLNPQSYMNDMRLVQDRWLACTDGYGSILNFDIKLLKEGYGRPIIPNDIYLLKDMPLTVPKVEYLDDVNYNVNNLRGKLFQFRTSYGYGGNMTSVYSPISKRPTPSNEGSSTQGQTVTKDNCIKVSVVLGDEATDKLTIAMRYNENNNWVIVKELKTKYIKELPNSTVSLSEGIKEAYDVATNTYTFIFYNDGSYIPIDINDTDLAYDAVPSVANTLEVVNGNIIALGGITEGFDRPTDVEAEVSTTTYKLNIGTDLTVNRETFNISGRSDYRNPLFQDAHYYNYVTFTGTPEVGDVIKVVLMQENNSANTITVINHTVTAVEVNDKNRLYQNLANEVAGGEVIKSSVYYFPPIRGEAVGIFFETKHKNRPFKIKSTVVELVNLGTLDSKSYNVLKSGSMYQAYLAYYGEGGKYFPLVSGDSYKIQTPPIAESQGLTPQLNWTINSKPPVGAIAYEWLLTENLKMSNWVTLTAKYDSARSVLGDYVVLEVPSLKRFIDSNKGVVSYQYVEGDKCTFIKTTNGVDSTAIKWFNFPSVEVDVISFEPEIVDESGVSVTKYFLKVRKSSNLNIADIEGKEVEIELYTPRAIGDSKTTLCFGVGEVFPIVDNEHSVTSGTIREGDCYLKGRVYESTLEANKALAYIVEDPNFSDSYRSKFYSYGRARFYDDEVGRVNKKGSIRYSDVTVLGGHYNGLNRFYLGRIYGEGAGETTSKYGEINKLQMRDSYLIAIHELKVAHIPVYLTIIEDNEGNLQIADSSKLFGQVRYLAGNCGTGTAKNSVSISKTGNVYFVDNNNNVVVRDGYDGIRVITGEMSKWFNERIKESKSNEDRIITYYNDFHNELNVTFLTVDGEVYQFNFDRETWDYEDSYNVQPNEISISNEANGVVSYNNITGVATFTPNTNFTGMASFDVNFQGVTKKVCIDFTEGNSVPNQFDFVDREDVPQNQYILSTIITIQGLTMPSPITVSGGEYSVNGGSWTNNSGTIQPNDTVQLRIMSSPDITTTTSMSVNIGGVSDTFSVTTLSQVIVGNIYAIMTLEPLSPQTGSLNQFKAVMLLSEPISETFDFSYEVYYSKSGQIMGRVFDGSILAGDTVWEDWVIPDADPSVEVDKIFYGLLRSSPGRGAQVLKYNTTDKYILEITDGNLL